ncbi:MAG: Flp1 family type IVb pilin [Bdellovibrionales bacterium]
MKTVTTLAKKLWKDESGQGATEYILLLVVVVMLAMIFKGRIKSMVEDKLTALASDIAGFTSGGN